MERITPVTIKPSKINFVLLPVIERQILTSRFPSPDLLINALKINTPIKKITLIFPNPTFTILANEFTPNTDRSAIARIPVKWNGIASVIHNSNARTRTDNASCPVAVSSAPLIVVIDDGNVTFLIIIIAAKLIAI